MLVKFEGEVVFLTFLSFFLRIERADWQNHTKLLVRVMLPLKNMNDELLGPLAKQWNILVYVFEGEFIPRVPHYTTSKSKAGGR